MIIIMIIIIIIMNESAIQFFSVLGQKISSMTGDTIVVDDTTRMNVRWKTGSQVKRARANHQCVKQTKEEIICGIDEF